MERRDHTPPPMGTGSSRMAASSSLLQTDIISIIGESQGVVQRPNRPLRTSRPPVPTGGADASRATMSTVRDVHWSRPRRRREASRPGGDGRPRWRHSRGAGSMRNPPTLGPVRCRRLSAVIDAGVRLRSDVISVAGLADPLRRLDDSLPPHRPVPRTDILPPPPSALTGSIARIVKGRISFSNWGFTRDGGGAGASGGSGRVVDVAGRGHAGARRQGAVLVPDLDARLGAGASTA